MPQIEGLYVVEFSDVAIGGETCEVASGPSFPAVAFILLLL